MKDIYSYPLITVSIVNLNGSNYLKDCLESLKKLNYPTEKIEIIIVDNGSNDDSVEFVRNNYPEVKLICNNGNLGFAKANNQAAAEAKGDYVAFLNNDTKVDENWLIELLRPVYGSDEIICSGSKVLSFDGKSIDFAGGMINFEAKGFQIDYGRPKEKDNHNIERFLPFVNGGAMLVKRDVFLNSGGFDEDFFAYYEDVDLGWRLWVLGYKVVFAPDSIIYHMHHGTSKAFSDDKLRYLKERNALISLYKNYGEQSLSAILAATFSNIFARIFTDFKFDYKSYYNFDINDKNSSELSKKIGDEIRQLEIDPQPLSSLMAVKDFLDNIAIHKAKRDFIQSNRRRDDKALFTYFKGQFLSVSGDENYQKQQINMLSSLGIYDIFNKKIKRTILLVSDEVIDKEMAGPAIRIWNFAEVLSRYMHVIIASPNKPDLPDMEFEISWYSDDISLGKLVERADIILCGGTSFNKFKSLKRKDRFLILDIYDPYNLATLEEYSSKPIKERIGIHEEVVKTINEQLYWGDFFLCASERQRDFWLGMLAALNRINPITYYADSTLRKTIDVVPFGLPDSKPVHTTKVLKGVVGGIREDDFVIIWGGGIYNWFDPLSLIKAMRLISLERDDIKLFFMGVKHPNPMVKELSLVGETVNLAKSLGIFEKNVFFNFGWVKYDERQNYLMESDAGIITHPLHIETRFSFRTRVLDYIWADLPVISTEGDFFSDLIKTEKIGLVVKEKDPQDIAEAIKKIADDKVFYKSCVENISRIADDYRWEKACSPLVKFCMDPVISAVKDTEGQSFEKDNCSAASPGGRKRCLISSFFYHLSRSGPKKTFNYVSNYLNRK